MSLKRSTTNAASQKSMGRSGMGHTAATVDPLDPSQLDVNVIGWANLDQKFQELRGLLSAPASGLNAHEARAQQKHNVSNAIVQLLDRAQQDCRRLLVEGNAKAAVEGGLKTLRLKEAYYGHGHLQLVPAYFHLARTNQYMDKFKAAEEFLSLAQWTILRNKDVDVSLKAELHQTFGLLYASDAKLDAALKQLTSATYYLCVMNGPEHILTSFGYFDLGNVFAAKSNMEHAMSFYDKVKDIWYQHLTLALRLALEPSDDDAVAPGSDMLVAANFGIENLQDAVKMLRGIVGLQTERYGRVHPSTSRSEFVLGMFMLWNGDAASAVGSLLKALEISKRVFGDRHPNTGEIRSLMLNFHLDVPDDTAYVLEDGFDGELPPPAQQQAPVQRTATPPTQQRIPTPPTNAKQHDSPRRTPQDNEGESAETAEVQQAGQAFEETAAEVAEEQVIEENAVEVEEVQQAIEENAAEVEEVQQGGTGADSNDAPATSEQAEEQQLAETVPGANDANETDEAAQEVADKQDDATDAQDSDAPDAVAVEEGPQSTGADASPPEVPTQEGAAEPPLDEAVEVVADVVAVEPNAAGEADAEEVAAPTEEVEAQPADE